MKNLRTCIVVFFLTSLAFSEAALGDFTETTTLFNGGNTLNLNSRSASLADIDNDNDLDLLFQGSTGAQKLYRNDLNTGSLGFTQIADLTSIGVTAGSWSAAWADINGDGFVDAFVGQSNIGQTGDLLTNDGDSTFSNVSLPSGLNDPGFHQNLAWADIDNDQDLDLVMGMEGPEKHEIYLQGPGRQFTPVGASVGFQEDLGFAAYGMALGDTDNDGDVDIYIATCRFSNNIRNNFYENQLIETGSLSFDDIADDNGTQNFRNNYGAEFYDFDDDGDLDLFVVGADQEASKIYRNDGGNQFTDVDTITGVPLLSDTGGDLNGGRAVDYDNDGDLDLFFHDHLNTNGSNQARKLYRNDGNWQFTDVTVSEGINTVNMGSYDSPWADIDNDGDMDLIATTDSTWFERVYLNDASTNGNHWLQVELDGPSYNTTGVGASLFATINEGTPEERTIRREANTNAGTFNQSDLPVHFGLGDADTIDELLIRWHDGTIQVLKDISVDQFLTIDFADVLVGDFNGDGVVNAADYTRYREDLGRIFRESDLDAWSGNLGAVAPPPTTSVPEPTAAAMLLLAAVAGSCVRSRRS